MDPLSIASTSATLVVLCGKCVFHLSHWISEVKEVNNVIQGFSGEIRSLENVLRSLEWTLQSKTPAAVDQTINLQNLWVQVNNSMSDTKHVLEKIEKIVMGFGVPSRNFLRKAYTAFRINLQTGDLNKLRERLNLLIGALSLPLQMITLYVNFYLI
jgi:hypothetical protein